jgi:pimeloyl-ACP methyl ester carboxylesterase
LSGAAPAEPVTPRSLFVPRGGRRLHILEWPGDPSATALLCLHGGCANAHWWYASAAILAGRRRVLALDLSGHGASDHLESGDYSLAGHRDDVVHVAADLDLRDFALMGHSFGGFVAVHALPSFSDRLAALVLVDSRGHIRERAARYLNALRKFPNPKYASREEAIRGFQLLPRQSSAPAGVLAHVARHSVRRADDGSWSLAFDRRALRAAEARRFDDEMRAWQGPTLLVRGAESSALSPRALAELQRELPQAETVEIAGAHHHVMLDRPVEFANAIARFLDRGEGTPRPSPLAPRP